MKVKISPAEQRRLAAGTGDSGDLDLYFEVVFGSHRPAMINAERGWHPPADMYETDDALIVRVDIAGIDIRSVSLVLDKTTLTLSGVRNEPEAEQRRQYHKMEVSFGPFERVFKLPCSVCSETPRAEYKVGFLTVTLKKQGKPVTKKKSIQIR